MSVQSDNEIRDVYSITRLNREVRAVLEGSFPPLWVQGEISNLARPASGHLYFSLKDASSQVRCAMFRNRNQVLRFAPENGMQVLVRATVSLYEGRGEFQMLVDTMEPAGAGALQLAFEQLRDRLRAEGVFDEALKRPLPPYPGTIGIITSPTGAAVRDILHVLARRYPPAGAIIYPVPVQGADAASRIEATLDRAGQLGECDVLILARGGGSLEDLQAFNEERIARAIRRCAIPVVTGVGHEVDFTIADFAADYRAPTPSAAAERVTPDITTLRRQLATDRQRLVISLERVLSRYRERLRVISRSLADPVRYLREQGQHLDEMVVRLQRQMTLGLDRRLARLRHIDALLGQFNPSSRLTRYDDRCRFLENRLSAAMRLRLERFEGRLRQTNARLHTLSPLATLGRGYALVMREETGQIVRDAGTISEGQMIQSKLARGTLTSRVTRVEKDDENT